MLKKRKFYFIKKDMKMELEIVCILYNIKLKIDFEIENFYQLYRIFDIIINECFLDVVLNYLLICK